MTTNRRFEDLLVPSAPLTQRDASRVLAHYQALGEFAVTFGEVEASLFLVVRSLTGAPENVLQVLLDGQLRASNLKDRISLLLPILADKSITPSIKEALEKLTILNDARNKWLHSLTTFSGRRETIVSNIVVAKTDGHVRQYRVSAELIQSALHDLRKVLITLYHFIDDLNQSRAEGQYSRRFSDPGMSAILGEPWLYKPEQPLTEDQVRDMKARVLPQ